MQVNEAFPFDQTRLQTDVVPGEGAAMPGQCLLVLGAGPKAIAIAAKRYMLAKRGYKVPRLVIVDSKGVVAHWSGGFGFTDGRQLLGTRPEKDVGYPYASTSWGDDDENQEIAGEMFLLSWHSYLVHMGKYLDWVDRGRTRPTHREWSCYLQWVASRIEFDVVLAEVRTIVLSEDGKRWQLVCRSTEDDAALTVEGDGLVITGPGTPITIEGQPANHPRVMDGGSFWLRVEEFARLRVTVSTPLHIGVIGTGETAAAIVIALLSECKEKAFIEVVSPNGVLYSRDEGFEENRLFSDPDAKLARLRGGHKHQLSWLRMNERDRREFLRRTDRGVFSVHAMEEVNRAENVRSVMGTARRMQVTEEYVFVDMEYDGEVERDTYDYVIVAVGFNALWFTKLLQGRAYERLAGVTGSFDRVTTERAIGEDLSIRGFEPRLHLPMLAGVAQGPGFPNLSCLGLLSDRILASYAAGGT